MGGRIALITEPAVPGLRPDDALLVAPLAARGIAAEALPWGAAPADLAGFDLAVLRTPWDYHEHVDTFLAWCEALPVPLLNPPAIVRWNAHKRYLLELERRGLARVSPTEVLLRGEPHPTASELAAALHGRASEDPLRRLVVKPAVSGGARGTFVLDPADPAAEARLTASVRAEDMLVQRYEPRLVADGEWSLVFFDGEPSHALVKRPRRGDFRVQAEHGGAAQAATAHPRHVAGAQRLLAALAPESLLYARVDGFVAADGELVLVELELIEPELFLRFGGADAFAAALAARIARADG